MAVLPFLIIVAACSSTTAESAPESTVETEAPASTAAPDATSASSTTSTTEPSSADPATERQDAIERTLVTYTEAINDRRGADAYALFTEDLKARIPLSELVDGTSTSFISRLSVASVGFDNDNKAATVIASFRSDQDPSLGPGGQACTIWELEYQMIDAGDGLRQAGDWLIDRATNLAGSPFACPVAGGGESPTTNTTNSDGPPIVHLTLDDGPGPETEKFLDLFSEFDIKATFFVNSNRIDGRQATVQRIVAEGHAIANHTHSHCNLKNPERLTPGALCGQRSGADEIGDAQRIIADTTGVTPSCFRPPYGAQSAATKALVAQFGLTNWLWDIDTNDWKFNSAGANYSDGQALAELDKAATLVPAYGSEGVIVLLHDGTASAPRMRQLLRSWLESNAAGYDFRPLTGC